MIEVTAFASVPPFARGLVRDLRVRWALEEAGLPHVAHLLAEGEADSPAYRARQPFGQVPAFRDADGLELFESGAIVFRIGERSEALLPADPHARARALQWAFAALNSVEPHLNNFALLDLFHAGQDWARLRRPSAEAFARRRLGQVAAALGDLPYLDGERFTAGDLLMASVLRIAPALVEDLPALATYRDRCTSRPAFARALAAQLADFDRTEAAQ